ncbi:hypothetical protein ACLKA7_012113, partial [Drosophila subpalustris]
MPAQVTVNSAISQSSEIQRQPTPTTNAHHMGSIMPRPGSIELYAPNENVATHQLHGQMELKHVATSQQHVPNSQMYAPNENVATHQLHGQIESASVAASQQHVADAQMYMSNVNAATNKLHGQMKWANVVTSSQHIAEPQTYMYSNNVATLQSHDQRFKNVETSQQQTYITNMQMPNVNVFPNAQEHPGIFTTKVNTYPYNNDRPMYEPSHTNNFHPYASVKEMVALLPEFDPSSEKSLDSRQFIKRVESL